MRHLTLFKSVQVTRRNGVGCDLDTPARMLYQRQVGGRSILGRLRRHKPEQSIRNKCCAAGTDPGAYQLHRELAAAGGHGAEVADGVEHGTQRGLGLDTNACRETADKRLAPKFSLRSSAEPPSRLSFSLLQSASLPADWENACLR